MRYLLKLTFLTYLVCLLSSCGWLIEDNSLHLNLIFEDAQSIDVGTPLTFNGVTIGDVTNMKLLKVQATESDAPCKIDDKMREQLSQPQVVCVSIAVDEANRPLVHIDSDFLIRSSALVSFPNQKEIEMTVWDSNSPELAEGATLIGSENLLDFYWKQAQRWERDLVLGELTIHTELAEDGTITRAYLLNSYLPIEAILDDLLPVGEVGWEVSRSVQEEAEILRVSRVFPAEAGVTSKNSEVMLMTNESLLSSEYLYTETFKAGEFRGDQTMISAAEWQSYLSDWYNRLSSGGGDPAGVGLEVIATLLNQVKAGIVNTIPLDRIVTVITIKMPGEINKEETNATFIVGDQASWVLTAKDLNEGFTAKALARGRGLPTISMVDSGSTLWIGGGILVAIVGGVGGFWVFRKIRDDNARIDDVYPEDFEDDLVHYAQPVETYEEQLSDTEL